MDKILVRRWYVHHPTIERPDEYPVSAEQITAIGADFTNGKLFEFEIIWLSKQEKLVPQLIMPAPALGLANTVFLDFLAIVAYEVRTDNPNFLPDYLTNLLELMEFECRTHKQ